MIEGIFCRDKPRRTKFSNLLPFLQDNPDAGETIKTFIWKNLDGITVQQVMEYIHQTVLLNVAGHFLDVEEGTEAAQEQIEGLHEGILSISRKEVLKFYGLESISHSTVYRWMLCLGMTYCERKKKFYVDGHERKDVVMSQWSFVKHYLEKEIQMYCWIQIPRRDAEILIQKGEIHKNSGYQYKTVNGDAMMEFHVDAHQSFHQKMVTSEFGGNPSVRKPEDSKMIISFGHDEAIFNKDTYTSRCWSGCNGEQPLIPKGEGMGLMFSALQS